MEKGIYSAYILTASCYGKRDRHLLHMYAYIFLLKFLHTGI